MGGTYTLAEPTQPGGYFDGQEARGGVLLAGSMGSDTIGNVVVGIGATSANHTFAEVPPVDPTGYVYVDANNNGTRDAGEVGIAGVTITLSSSGLDVFGNVVVPQTAVTNAAGYYQFANLPPAVHADGDAAGRVPRRPRTERHAGRGRGQQRPVREHRSDQHHDGRRLQLRRAAAGAGGGICLSRCGQQRAARRGDGPGQRDGRLTGTDDLGAAVNLARDGGRRQLQLRQPAAGHVHGDGGAAGRLPGRLETRGNVTPLPGSVGGPNTIGGIVVGSGQTAGNNNFGDVPPATVSGRVFVDHNNSGTLERQRPGLGGVTVTLSGHRRQRPAVRAAR